MSKKPNEEVANSRFKKANRGTNDELEIIGFIVANHPGLRISVHEKLKQAKRRVAARESRNTVKDAG
jgi:hypothetical protein